MIAGFFDSPAEIGIILLIVLLLFGGSQLPKLAKNIGKAQQEFKSGLAEGQKDETKDPLKSDDSSTPSA
jgi:sec-independent protein translocase protein TatA